MKALVFTLSIPKFIMLQLAGRLSRQSYYRGPFSMLKLEEIPEPELPSGDWVKIRTRLCGFCGSDLNLLLLKDSLMASPFTSFPCVIGHELCGDVVQAGKNVKNCKIGDLVTVAPMLGCVVRGIDDTCPACESGRPGNCENFAEGPMSPGMFMGLCKDAGGGFAEYIVAHKSQVFRVPGGVSAESAALVEPLAVALQAVLDNRPEKGEKALVVGGGVIGSMIVKAIRGLGIGCDITVVEPSAFQAEYVKHSGADHVTGGGILEAAEEFAGARAYRPIMGPRILQGGFNRVYDTVGHSKTLQESFVSCAALGTVSIVGIGNKVTFDPTPIWLKLLSVKGVYAYGYVKTSGGRKHVFELALDLLKRKRVRVEDMLTHTLPIDNYRELIELNFKKGISRAMKTAISFQHGR